MHTPCNGKGGQGFRVLRIRSPNPDNEEIAAILRSTSQDFEQWMGRSDELIHGPLDNECSITQKLCHLRMMNGDMVVVLERLHLSASPSFHSGRQPRIRAIQRWRKQPPKRSSMAPPGLKEMTDAYFGSGSMGDVELTISVGDNEIRKMEGQRASARGAHQRDWESVSPLVSQARVEM
ncbi:hypothetical protein I7I51_03993 [Histoplasma capsulatum]|uniref:Uncharacterized protein n=1 Tax=Ajellomyces capsulatus TaxID=5037 RepID=A0A8A1M5N7_AJECA|nr:hypothetical protein I7I51_03993 [Histoplasma capsulatum]